MRGISIHFIAFLGIALQLIHPAMASLTEGPAESGQRESGPIMECIQSEGAILREVRSRGHFETLISRLRTLCREFPNATITVFSGYRSPQHNRNVGGASHSRHISADALDFRISENNDRVRRVLGQFPGGRGSYPDGSFHIDLGPDRCWGSMQSYCRESRELAGNYERGLSEIRRLDAAYVAAPPVTATNGPDRDPATTSTIASAPISPQVSRAVEPYYAHGIPSQTQTGARANDNSSANMAKMQLLTQTATTFASLKKQSPSAATAKKELSADAKKTTPAPTSGASQMPGREPASTSGASRMPDNESVENATPTEEATDFRQIPAVFPSIAPPKLCANAATIRVNYCDQNYALALEAGQCLLRLRQAERLSGSVLREKTIQDSDEKQNFSYRNSSYDYRVAETVAQRQLLLFRQELAELRQYLGIRVPPEDMNPNMAANEPCWREPSKEIQRVISEVEKKVAELEITERANNSLKQDTKADESEIGNILGID